MYLNSVQKMVTDFKIVLVLFLLWTDISLRYFYVIVVSRIYYGPRIKVEK